MRRGHSRGRLSLGRWLAIAALATVLLLLSAGPALASGTYTIGGTVTGNGHLIPNMRIEIYDAVGQEALVTYTNDYGRYDTQVTIAGPYTVRTREESSPEQGYLDQWYSTDPSPDFCRTDPEGEQATRLDVSRTDLNFSLTPGYIIRGRVTDASNPDPDTNGIPNVRLVVGDGSDPEVACGLTDTNGDYSTEDNLLPPGSYKVATASDGTSNPAYVPQWYTKDLSIHDYSQTDPAGAEATPVEVVSDNVEGIDLVLTPGHSISGAVTGKDGELIPDVGIQVYDAAGQDEIAVWIEDGVHYSTGALIPGSYTVRTRSSPEQGYLDQWYSTDPSPDFCRTDPEGEQATPVNVSSGNAIDINFALALGYRISGRVTDSTNPNPLTNGIPEVCMIAFDESGNEVYLGKDEGLDQTDSDGHYTTIALAPGVYKVMTANGLGYMDQWYQDDPVQTDPSGREATWVDVRAGDATVDFSLARSDPLAMLRDLLSVITNSPSTSVDPVIRKSLTADVNAALAALTKGNKNANKVAVNNLNALINHVNAQTGKKISADAAAEIIRRANAIIAALGH